MASRAVLITGCSSGIGLAAAQYLHTQGYQVIATCRQAQDVARLKQQGLTALILDLNDSDSIALAVEQTLALTKGSVYGLFNNAGYGVYGPLQTVTRQQLEAQFATNLFGTHELTRLLLPTFLQQGEGRIIQTSSVLGQVATPGRGAYCASKYALEAWSDALRMELYGTGINVSLIEPGPIQTQFTKNVKQTQQATPISNPLLSRRFALQANDVLPKLKHALESALPRARYSVTLITPVMIALKKILPVRWMDRILVNRSTN